LLYEDAAQNIFGLVYDKDGNLLNIVAGVGKLDPLPFTAFEEAARRGFPYAPQWSPCCHGGKTMEQQAAELEAQKHHIASIYTNQSPTALFPTNGDSVAKQFMLRWIF
jgi:hypothetical protein